MSRFIEKDYPVIAPKQDTPEIDRLRKEAEAYQAWHKREPTSNAQRGSEYTEALSEVLRRGEMTTHQVASSLGWTVSAAALRLGRMYRAGMVTRRIVGPSHLPTKIWWLV
jgi:hypothetical protein